MHYKTVGTHNGSFHVDELVALSTLKIYNPRLKIIRTRDDDILNSLDARVDVGKRYNYETNDFDHHQKEGAGKRENGVSYASAGLIWKHFGGGLCESSEAHLIVDKKLIQYVDSIDNGDIQPDSKSYSLFEMVKGFNTSVNAEKIPEEEAFNLSQLFLEQILVNEITSADYQTKANVNVRDSLKRSGDKPFVVLDQDISWQPVIVGESNRLYVIYPDKDGTYRVRCVPTVEEGFEPRRPFPIEWRGLKQRDLQETTGIEDILFCHSKGFVASTQSLEGAIRLAEKVSEIKV